MDEWDYEEDALEELDGLTLDEWMELTGEPCPSLSEIEGDEVDPWDY